MISYKTKPIMQPNSRHCFVCGLENNYGLKLRFKETGPGEVTADYTVPEHFQGYPGVVHGGIVTAMLDEVTGRDFAGLFIVVPSMKRGKCCSNLPGLIRFFTPMSGWGE